MFFPSDRRIPVSKYRATVVHSSISSHYSIEVSDDLEQAKKQAARRFGKGFVEHRIRIYDSETRETISERRIGGIKWSR
jgi:hypothetical protein